MTVLSLFDGMSCGQIALRELGVGVVRYYASEIDKFAIAQTRLNFPDTVQLGDAERWRDWEIDWSGIDLVIGGSPCQGFSLAGRQLAFDDPRSRLFFAYADILDHVKSKNPSVKFLLENVVMRKEHIKVINERLGLRPILINSSLVSAQNRKRLYWSNIRTRKEGLFGEVYTDIPLPEDRGLVIKDILESGVDAIYLIKDGFGQKVTSKCRTLRVGGGSSPTKKHCWDIIELDKEPNSIFILQRARGYNQGGGVFTKKSPTLTSCHWEQNNTLMDKRVIRRLTPTECARLQTIPDWYKWECSKTQQYKMLGNGWTVEVIKHIFKYL